MAGRHGAGAAALVFLMLLLVAGLPRGRGAGRAAAAGLELRRRDGLRLGRRRHLTTPPTQRPPLTCNFDKRRKATSGQEVSHADFFDGYSEVAFQDAGRYRLVEQLGSGVQGSVMAAVDSLTNKAVAIKKLAGFFTPSQPMRRKKRVLGEALIMQGLLGVDGVAQRQQVLPTAENWPKNVTTVYIVMEQLDYSLKEVAHRAVTSMPPLTKKWLIYQMVLSLRNIHSHGVVHNDVGNHNILLSRDCTVKLIDFGNALPIERLWPEASNQNGEVRHPMPSRIFHSMSVTVPYPQHTLVPFPAHDVYLMGLSILCFAAGESYVSATRTEEELVRAWVAEFGVPSRHTLAYLTSSAARVIRHTQREERGGAGIASLWPNVDPEVLKFARRMVDWELQNIPTAAELLNDSFFNELRSTGLVQGPLARTEQPKLQHAVLRMMTSLVEGEALPDATLFSILHSRQ